MFHVVGFDFHYLHRDVVYFSGNTLQTLVVAAPPTAEEEHAGGLEDVLKLLWVLLLDVD